MDLMTKLDDLTIDPEELKVKLEDPIGQGNFGVIYLGQLIRDEKYTTVAVKMLKGL